MGDESVHAAGRYARQERLPQIGPAGQRRLAEARVLLVGCGALGTVVAEQLVRAGVGLLRIVDRDTVELSNLQRQTLFDEEDARQRLPKAIAAANRLRRINSQVSVEAVVADLHPGNVEELCGVVEKDCDLIVDATDNAETRYLLNDVAVKHSIPWIYGACIGTEGRVMPISPGARPCLRCIFPEPPEVGELETCETAGVLGPAAGVIASVQGAWAIQMLVSPDAPPKARMLSVDLWHHRWRVLELDDARRADCRCCGLKDFEFLNNQATASTISLCGRNAIQIRPSRPRAIDLAEMERRWRLLGGVQRTAHLLRFQVPEPEGIEMTLFPDGRLVIAGTSSQDAARLIAARYL